VGCCLVTVGRETGRCPAAVGRGTGRLVAVSHDQEPWFDSISSHET